MGRKNAKKQTKRNEKKATTPFIKGVVDISRSGMGYVISEGIDLDIMIRPGDLNGAMHGDFVSLAIKERAAAGKRMKGVVREVLKRKRAEFIGKIEMGKGFAFLLVETDKPVPDFFIPFHSLQGAQQGDRVLAKVTNWLTQENKRPQAAVVAILKEDDMHEAAMREILLEAGFPLHFSEEAQEESLRISSHIAEKEIEKRKDFRNTLTFTIDPIDAKDFDDALSVHKNNDGSWDIGVHIADVSHYVDENSATAELAEELRVAVEGQDGTGGLTAELTETSSVVASKPNVYRQDEPPTGTIPVKSVWYDTNNNNKP